MFKSPKFPVQYRNQCYCQLKNHCFQKCVPSNRKSKGINFFIKKNVTVGEPSNVNAFNTTTLPSSNVFKTTFQNTLEQRNANAFLHRSDSPDDQQLSFTSNRKRYEAQSSAATRKRPTTRQNESIKYADALDVPLSRIPDGGDEIHALYKRPQSDCPEDCSRATFSRDSFSTINSLRIVNKPEHVCQIHYYLNDRNQPVPVQLNADGSMQCYICDKQFDVGAKMPGIFRSSTVYSSSVDGVADVPSLILELSSCQTDRLLLRNGLHSSVDLRRNFAETVPNSYALRHQACV